MSKFTDFYENIIINHMLRGAAYTVPANVYVACFTTNTGLEAGTPSNTEISGYDYARQLLALNAAAGGATFNPANITFPVANGGNWGTINAIALCDHLSNVTWGTNVNALIWGDLTAGKTINNGDTFVIAANALNITVA